MNPYAYRLPREICLFVSLLLQVYARVRTHTQTHTFFQTCFNRVQFHLVSIRINYEPVHELFPRETMHRVIEGAVKANGELVCTTRLPIDQTIACQKTLVSYRQYFYNRYFLVFAHSIYKKIMHDRR